MIRAGAIVALLALCVSAAMAQEARVDPARVEACLAETPVGVVDPTCLGAASDACQETTPGGQTTLGIAACIQAETAVWDALLNREYGTTRDQFLQEAGLADALLAAQRAWIAYRDAECALAYAIWADGTIRSIVASNCHLVMTARRAIELRDMR